MWTHTAMASALLAASVGAMFAHCYGFAFLFMVGSFLVWIGLE